MKREDETSPAAASASSQGDKSVSPEDEQLKAEREARKKKKEEEKAAKEAAKAAKKLAQEQELKAAAALLLRTAEDVDKDLFGYLPLVTPDGRNQRDLTPLAKMGEKAGETVWIRARLQESRCKGSLAFLVLRDGYETAQVVCGSACGKDFLKWVAAVPTESLLLVSGKVSKPDQPIQTTTQQHEVQCEKVFCVSRSQNELPFQLRDAAVPDGEEKEGQIKVYLDTRLDNRCLDLRLPASLGIQRVQSFVCKSFRDFLHSRDFIEIQTPKLLPGASEGGASCFTLQYFNKQACLAQSPQLYKQMCICADFKRVFEVGPVFRAENSNTHRHLCEFVGLDLEMEIQDSYLEAVDVIDELLKYIFREIQSKCSKDLEAIRTQFAAPEFKFLETTPRLTFQEGIELLRASGVGLDVIPQDISEFDLSTELERQLGRLVKEKFGTDYFILLKYPSKVRPFYTMPSPEDPRFSNSFDIFMRGEEIVSGAQRVHCAATLEKRCQELGVPTQPLQAYIDAIRLGAPPHAGMGLGLARLVMLFFDLGNIRRVALFPRDPKRISP